jgi:hypothetical protein
MIRETSPVALQIVVGIVPFKHVEDAATTVSKLLLKRDEGIVPVSSVIETSIVSSEANGTSPVIVDKLPVNLLFERITTLKVSFIAIREGTDPVNKLSLIVSTLSCDKLESGGMVPVKLFSSKSRYRRLVI